MTIKNKSQQWFEELRNQICSSYEKLEQEFCHNKPLKPGKFNRKKWERNGGGGGEMSIMKGQLFEKVGVNISTVFGEFSPEFCQQIPGAKEDPRFFATGISLVAHMRSPLIPAVHFNTRYIETTKSWFGGGADLNPIYPEEQETKTFHDALKKTCNKFNPQYYDDFKKHCDEYFFIKHRNEPRGVGGIFFDYLENQDKQQDLNFVQEVGKTFRDIYPEIVRNKMFDQWTEEQREYQLFKRGRYTEFNLIYDRGTKFGLMTDGNPEAILMSLPPLAKWD